MRDAGFSKMQIKQATEEAQHAARERNKGAKRLIRLDEMMANRRFRVSKRRAEARFIVVLVSWIFLLLSTSSTLPLLEF